MARREALFNDLDERFANVSFYIAGEWRVVADYIPWSVLSRLFLLRDLFYFNSCW